jgi:hypothetical protein
LAKIIVAGLSRIQTEDERRAGGNMGQPSGVGYDGIDKGKVPLPNVKSIHGGRGGDIRRVGDTKSVKVRLVWESAMPVRAAELKALKREGEKDVKPSRVEVFQRENE